MTENEAIIQLNFDMEMIRFNPDTGETLTLEEIKEHNEDNYKTYLADEVAITALMDIQQYRSIGTVEYIQLTFSLCKGLENIVKMYEAFGNIEEFKVLKEKNTPKKPNKDEFDRFTCPDCGWIVSTEEYGGRFLTHCENCGQTIDWSE